MLALAAFLPGIFWDRPPETLPLLERAGIHAIAVPESRAAEWGNQDSVKVSPVDAAALTKLPAPRIDYRINEASATTVPWLETNGAAILRNPTVAYLYNVNGRAAAIAAGEAALFGGRAYIDTDEEGLLALSPLLDVIARLNPEPEEPITDIGVIDDGSPRTGEVLKLLVRYNLLARPERTPDRRLLLNVRIGSSQYPLADAADPHKMALKIRGDLGDDRRSLRVYGSDVVIGRLSGTPKRMRLQLLNYSQRPVRGLRIRVKGRFSQSQVQAAGISEPRLRDFVSSAGATEFTIPLIDTFLVVDLAR